MRSSSSRPRPSGDGVGQRDAVKSVVVVDLADGEHGRQHAVGVHAVLRVAPGAYGVPLAWPDGKEPVFLPYSTLEVIVRMDWVGTRRGRPGALDLAHDRGDDPLGDVVGAVVVVAVDRELASVR